MQTRLAIAFHMLEGARPGGLGDKATYVQCWLYSALVRIPAFIIRFTLAVPTSLFSEGRFSHNCRV
ncbi:hypothetical protein ACSS6W_010330 [Trichoderma asperelloides]